jgi:hypothetical protein
MYSVVQERILKMLQVSSLEPEILFLFLIDYLVHPGH